MIAYHAIRASFDIGTVSSSYSTLTRAPENEIKRMKKHRIKDPPLRGLFSGRFGWRGAFRFVPAFTGRCGSSSESSSSNPSC